MKPIIQLTLNSMKLEDAIRTAELVKGDVDWLGVSNTLLKGEGLPAVMGLKKRFPEKKVLVDMKVVGSGQEIEAASKSGADTVIFTDDKKDWVLAELVKVARVNGIETMAEEEDINSLEDRYKFLEDIGVDYLLINLSGAEEIQRIRGIPERIRIPVAIGIGVNEGVVGDAVNSGAGIIVIEKRMDDGGDISRITKKMKDVINLIYQKKTPVTYQEKVSGIGSINLDGISADLERIKNTLVMLQEDKASEEKKREDVEKELEKIKRKSSMERDWIEKERKRLDDRTKELDEQRADIMKEWGKLRDAEKRWEKEQERRESEYKKRQETIWEEWEDEQRRRWREWRVRREREREEIDDEMKKVADAMKEIEELSVVLKKEREEIKEEWERIEKETRRIERNRKEIEDIKASVMKDKISINHRVEGMSNALVTFPKLISRISKIYKERERELRAIEKERNELIRERSKIEKEWKGVQEEEKVEREMGVVGKKEEGVYRDMPDGWGEIERIKRGFRKAEILDKKEKEMSGMVKGLSKIEKDLLRLKREHEGRGLR